LTRQYSTAAVVLGYRKLGEADRILDLFTESQGRVPTIAKGVRKVSSRWGGRLEPFTELEVQLHAGRSLHTLTGADTVLTHAGLRSDPACLRAGLSLAEMISRSTPELHRKPRSFNLLLNYLAQMDRLCPDLAAAASVLTLAAHLKLLLLAGFLPHLEACAVCGAAEDLIGFSADAGGVICTRCNRRSFPVSEEAVTAMHALLASPLASAAQVAVSESAQREIRRAIREICEFHLGIRLKVEPW